MRDGAVREMSEIVARDAYLINCDVNFTWCKHCRSGYNYTGEEVVASCNNGKNVRDYIIHSANCIVLDAKRILDKI